MTSPARALGALAALAFAAATASAQCNLQTLYATNNGGSVGGAVYFDLNVTTGIRITGFDVNTTTAASTPIGLLVYTIPGTHVGNEGNPGAWTQVGQDNGTGVAAGSNVGSRIPLLNPIILTPGQYGIALVAQAFNHSYTNGTGANQVYTNGCMTLTAGSATNAPFQAGPFTPRVWNGEILATPAAGLFANFSASTTSGATPLNVTFTDTSFTDQPGGVTSWAWDLNGDNIVDSNAQAPSFTYSTCGYYDVTLTVNDGVNPASTITKTDHIAADPQLLVVADFTSASGAVPLSYVFTDTSVGSPSAWSWDFDGDNVPDSAQQNPTWTYGTPGTYTVSLTASNACGGGTVRKQLNVLAGDECGSAIALALGVSPVFDNLQATTSFAWPCAAGGNDVWFTYDSSCNGSLEVTTCNLAAFDTALEAFSGDCSNLVSLVCNDDNCGLQSRITFAVAPNRRYYIRAGGYNSARGSFQLNLILSSSGNGNFTSLFPGCGGATLATTGQPNIGATVDFTLTPVQGLPFVMIGSVPLGVPLCPQGCIIGHNMDVVLPAPSFSATIPCWPFLVGGQVYFQGLDLGANGGCPSGNPVQLVTTNTVRATIG
ncbi:MAG: PKD domain-containing protein [Planctomycetes bacterium]|nr:PKD domain-containing protein [Planctomycetota bacterium]